MNFLEKNLEKIIVENCKTTNGIKELKKRGLNINDNYFKIKFDIEIGGYCFADIITINMKHFQKPVITVFEFEKKSICINTLIRAARCIKAIKKYIDTNKKYSSEKFNYKIILIGNEINLSSEWVYLFDGFFKDVFIYTYNYDIDGISFNECDLAKYELIL